MIAAALRDAQRCLEAVLALRSSTPWLLGSEPTLADLHAYPMLRVLSLAPEGAALLQRHPSLQRWLELMQQRPSVQRTRSSREPAAS